jgi:hypothetical protein
MSEHRKLETGTAGESAWWIISKVQDKSGFVMVLQ